MGGVARRGGAPRRQDRARKDTARQRGEGPSRPTELPGDLLREVLPADVIDRRAVGEAMLHRVLPYTQRAISPGGAGVPLRDEVTSACSAADQPQDRIASPVLPPLGEGGEDVPDGLVPTAVRDGVRLRRAECVRRREVNLVDVEVR